MSSARPSSAKPRPPSASAAPAAAPAAASASKAPAPAVAVPTNASAATPTPGPAPVPVPASEASAAAPTSSTDPRAFIDDRVRANLRSVDLNVWEFSQDVRMLMHVARRTRLWALTLVLVARPPPPRRSSCTCSRKCSSVWASLTRWRLTPIRLSLSCKKCVRTVRSLAGLYVRGAILHGC